ncbi:MAG: hypothetical protein R2828_07600 [Saprospiraceae bacterium]
MNKYEIDFQQKIDGLIGKPFNEVQAFLKPKKFRKSKCTELFWKSTLPGSWTKELLSLPAKMFFLFDYFSKPENINAAFLQTVAKINPQLLKRAIKLSKAFQNQEHWESFYIFKRHQNHELKIFYKELDFLRRLYNNWEEKGEFHKSVIQELDYEDILVHTISYFEKFKRSKQTISNQSLLTSNDISLCYVLNNLLNIKHAAINTTGEKIRNKYGVLEFKKAVEDTLPPLNTTEGLIKGAYLPVESISPEKKLIRETISFYFSNFETNYQIDKYLCGYADFETIEGMEATLKTNEFFATHWRNDKKNWYQENLARNKALQKKEVNSFFSKKIETFEKQNFLSIQTANEYWAYLKLPDHIPVKENLIEVKHLFSFLYTFSNYLMPVGRMVIYSEENPTQPQVVLTGNIPKKFSQLFESNYLYAIEESELLKNCCRYFGWDEILSKSLIDFLTTDLGLIDTTSTMDFLAKPLLKIGTQYVWLSSLLKDRKWEVLMHKRCLTEKLIDHSVLSSAIEKGLAENFQQAGFGAHHSFKFKNGEIDSIAYKEKTLFILELKTTFLDENLLRYGWYNAIRFEYKASDQLKNIEEYIRTNFEAIKSIPELRIDCRLDELKIIPLIVSNIFEIDGYVFHGEYLKVSLFELMVILNNDLYETLNSRLNRILSGENQDTPFSAVMQSFNRHAPHFKKDKLKFFNAEECNLWSTPKGCSPQDLTAAIDKKMVWKGLDEMMGFDSDELILIGAFTPFYHL